MYETDILVTIHFISSGFAFSLFQGGFGIMDEMCVNYIHYYPRTQLELCKSHVDTDYLQKYFSLINRCTMCP